MRIPSSGPADTVPPYSAEELSATARGVAVFSAIEKGVSATSVTTEEPLAGAILRTLLYFDLFDYPLRLEEIVRYLGIRLSRRVALGDALATLERTGLIAESNGYRFLTERSATIVTARLRREEQGRRMWRRARRIASLLRHIPFVRAIFISGSLSHGLAEKGSDIDYFIVTEPGRLWLVRTLLVFIRRTLLLNRRTYLCLNYFVTTDRLAIEERQIYAACETASVRPLYNEAIHADFVRSNEWIVDFYPNFTAATKRTGYAPIEKGRSIVQRLGESLVPRRLAGGCMPRGCGSRRFWPPWWPRPPSTLWC